MESSSDSDGKFDRWLIKIHSFCIESDFIDVPTITKSSEPIILPSDDDQDLVETSNNNNTSSEFIELDHDDESSHNSTAIEDIRMLIDNDKDQSVTTDVEPKDSSLSQLVRRILHSILNNQSPRNHWINFKLN
jgi:hypothetical protein